MKSEDENTHVLNAEKTVTVPLDYYDLQALIEELPEDERYENLRVHLSQYKDKANSKR